jgi:hypothetical protein
MSGQIAPLFDGRTTPATHTPPRPMTIAASSHGQISPDWPWCRCGNLREHCVSDEVRMIWGEPS